MAATLPARAVLGPSDPTCPLEEVEANPAARANAMARRGRMTCCGIDNFVLRCIFIAGLTSLLLGYDQGVLSGAKLYIRHDFELSDGQVELLVGILHVSALGALFAGWMSEQLGRRKTVALACLVFLAGGLLMALATTYEMLIVGRVVTGMGVGTGLTIAPLYMAELSPKRVRGALVSLTEISINIGVLLGFVTAWAFSGLDDSVSWRYMLGLGCVPPVVIAVGLLGMPESPRWLVRRGREDEALAVLCKTCQPSEAKDTLEQLRAEAQGPQNEGWTTMFRLRSQRQSLLVLAGIGVSFFQQASGLEALVGGGGWALDRV
jgi:MFS family permease